MIVKSNFKDAFVYILIATLSFSIFTFILENSKETTDPTVATTSSKSFLLPLKDLDKVQKRKFVLGKALFHGTSNDNRTPETKGIGPIYNALTCGHCHSNGGTGNPSSTPSLIVKIANTSDADEIDPIYGSQFQTQAIPPITPEAQIIVDDYSKVKIQELALGPIDKQSFPYNRITPKMIGLGLIEAIPNEFFLEKQDPNDKNNDGISGRIGFGINPETQQKEIARFGHKASVVNIKTQTLHAAFEDLGLSNSLFGTNCNFSISCTLESEMSLDQEEFLTFYSSVIAPPKKRSLDTESKTGKKLFNTIGCSSCHTGSIKLERTDLIKSDNIYIHPMADFLLHDLGQELGDPISVGNAGKNEFRTAPLWGLGLIEKVNGGLFLMHDGRARSIDEAIRMHGGEAEKSRLQYEKLSTSQREAIHSYLMTL